MANKPNSLTGIIATDSIITDLESKGHYVRNNDVLECDSETVVGYVKDGIAYKKEGNEEVKLGRVFYFGDFRDIGNKLSKFDEDLRRRIAENYPKMFENINRHRILTEFNRQ